MPSAKRIKKQHPLHWVVEALAEEPSYIEKAWFGCLSVFLHGRLMLVLCSGEEPWNGLLLATEHQFHDAILKEFKDVVQHPVIKKWLYLPEASEDFETTASEVMEAIGANDPRFGIEPKAKRPGKGKG